MNKYIDNITNDMVFAVTSMNYDNGYDTEKCICDVTDIIFIGNRRANFLRLKSTYQVSVIVSTIPTNEQVNELEPIVSFIERDMYDYNNYR